MLQPSKIGNHVLSVRTLWPHRIQSWPCTKCRWFDFHFPPPSLILAVSTVESIEVSSGRATGYKVSRKLYLEAPPWTYLPDSDNPCSIKYTGRFSPHPSPLETGFQGMLQGLLGQGRLIIPRAWDRVPALRGWFDRCHSGMTLRPVGLMEHMSLRWRGTANKGLALQPG